MLQVFVYLILLILQGLVWCETNAKPIVFLVTFSLIKVMLKVQEKLLQLEWKLSKGKWALSGSFMENPFVDKTISSLHR